MEVMMGMILFVQVVILIQIMWSKKQMLQYFKILEKNVMIQEVEDVQGNVENTLCKEVEARSEAPENAMKLVEEVLSEVFS